MKGQRSLSMAILPIALVALLALGACQAPSAAVDTPMPPTPTPTPAAPPLPDPKTDPLGALQYSSKSDLIQSMGFTMAMSMTLQPADDAATTALGDVVLAALQSANMTGSGTGVVEVTDKAAGQANMQMAMDVNAAGQEIKVETIVLDGKAWTRVGNGAWTVADAAGAQNTIPGGMDPMGMEDLAKNAIDVEYVGEEMRDGQSVQHLRFTLDPQKADLSAILGGSGVPADQVTQFLQDATMNVDTWLGTDDLLPRYQDMSMAFNLPGSSLGIGDASIRMLMDITMAYTNINEPVTIEAPMTQ